MSLDDYKGAAYVFRRLMREAQAEIDRKERKGATVRWKMPNPAKTMIGWAKRRLLRGEFRRRA
jgi:hypothetical protein